MATTAEQDLLFPKFKFKVTFMGDWLSKVGSSLAEETSFTEVNGLKMGVNATQITTINNTVARLPNSRDVGTLTLKRGVIQSTQIRKWVSDAVDKSLFWPLMVQVQLLNSSNKPAITWQCYNCWPISLEVEGFNSTSSEILYETLTLAYSSITVKT